MNQEHKAEAKRRKAQPSKQEVQRIDPERLRKAIQYLGERPAIVTRAPMKTPTALKVRSVGNGRART